MQAPLQITFHGLDRSEALEAKIRAQAEKFEQFCDRITGCHVVLEKPHRHCHQGTVYHVRIRLAVPRRELVVDREPAMDHAHEDPYVAVRDAFKAMRRQLEDYVRELRGDVKTHAAPPQPERQLSALTPAGGRTIAPPDDIRSLPSASAAAPLPPDPEAIRLRAYERWEAAGRPPGDGVSFWLQAEQELMHPR